MKRFISLVFCAFLLAAPLLSQKRMMPGNIITLSGETLEGQIDFRDWLKNPENIDFVCSNCSEVKTYGPTDIAGFSVSKELYRSAVIDVETSPEKLDELKFDPKLHIIKDTVFLLNLVSGTRELYKYRDSYEKEHFYVPTDSGMTLLIHKRYLRKIARQDMPVNTNLVDSTDIISENKTYIGQLGKYLEDCGEVLPKLSGLVYNQKSILQLFTVYRDQCNLQIRISTYSKIKTELGITGGIALNSIKFSSNRNFEFSNSEYKYKPNFAIGFKVDARFKGNIGKWSINNELLFTPYLIEGEYLEYINEEWYTNHTTEISVPYIRLNNMLRFRYPLGKSWVFINAGITNGIGKVKTNKWERDIKYYTTEEVETDIALDSPDSWELGFNAGFGVILGKWSAEARWERGDGMSTLAALKSITNRMYFLVGYSF